MPTVAVIGASTDTAKYGNKAVRAYTRQGYTVFPVNPNATTVEGLRSYASLAQVPGPVDRVALYLPPKLGITVLPDVAAKGPLAFFVSPGAESDHLLEEATRLGLEPILACPITDIGMNPRLL